jgi:uncharacterized protein YbjT (DUF2867 family)
VTEASTLVAGATGALGFQVCEALVNLRRRVTALVRPTADAGKVARLRDLGAEVVEGDLELPETLPAALAGASSVVTTASAFPLDPRPDALERVDRDGNGNLVDAAAAVGVRRFVFVSFRTISPDFPFQQAKRAVEARLAASGMEYAILRPGNFMDVWFSPLLGFDVAAGRVRVYGDGEAPTTWISSADVAQFAVWALDAEAARNATLDLGGPEALSQLEVADLYEELLGTPLERTHVPLTELERQHAEGAGPVERSFAGVLLGCAHGAVTDMRALVDATGIRLTTVRELAQRQLAATR